MSTFGKRLAACIDERGTKPAELARKAGITGASVSDWVHDKVQPDHVKAAPLLRAAAFLHVNPSWLLLGRGSKHPEAPAVLHAAEPPARYRAWPFEGIDPELVARLTPREVIQIEGAWLLAARQLGFTLGKPDAA